MDLNKNMFQTTNQMGINPYYVPIKNRHVWFAFLIPRG